MSCCSVRDNEKDATAKFCAADEPSIGYISKRNKRKDNQGTANHP